MNVEKLEKLKAKMNQESERYEDDLLELNSQQKVLRDTEQEVLDNDSVLTDLLYQKEYLLKATDKGRQKSVELLEGMITDSLRDILKQDIFVKLETSIKDGTPSSEMFIFQKDDKGENISYKPINGSGGIRDVISLVSMVALRILESPRNSAPLFLDEPFKNMSRDYADNVALFVKKMNTYVGVQIFVITHERDIMPNTSDRTFLVEKNTANESQITIYK